VHSIELDRVSFAYSDSVPLLSELSLRLFPGWYGVVGPNGSGKTTLLRLIAGELEPDPGEVRLHPEGVDVRLCPQSVESPSSELRSFASSRERLAQRLLGQLRLHPSDLDRWDCLSAGERKRWQLGAALSADPAAVLLDEPTNHLDREARALLLGALERFGGLGLVVSHDRALLNRLPSHTLRFHQGEVRLYRGGYDEARRTWEAEEREKLEGWESIRAEQRHLERRLSDRRRDRAHAESRMRTSRRMKGPRDSDARGLFKQKRRRSAEVSLGREIGKIRGRLLRLAEQASQLRFQKTLGRSLFVDYLRAPMAVLLELAAPRLCAGPRVLLEPVDVALRRDSRAWLLGPNGAGKSTLLRELVARSRLPASRLLYLPQELAHAEEVALLDSVRALDPEARARVLSLVAALGVDPDTLLESRSPSPGEARKLALASGLAQRVWALVLDEPTNHLDLPSIERLEEMLSAYPGALLLVTHDDVLARRCTTTQWEISERRLVVRSRGSEG
jgi:ATPase subunit of ABC transporter with duplicated ATPase domains